MRRVLIIGAVIAVLAALAALLTARTRAGQDFLLDRALTTAFAQPPSAAPSGGIRVFMCGTSSPLPAPGRAQACVTVQLGERLFVVDAGAGSANVTALAGMPMGQLEAVLLTHFHSDHIAEIAELNLNSWIQGRPEPLRVIGPQGVDRIVDGLHQVYLLDHGYRVEHHGTDLLPPELHEMRSETIMPGVVLDDEGLLIRAFAVNHAPVSPVMGYRFDYGGRSVVITGDTVATPGLEDAARDADLLIADALSLPIVQGMERAARGAGQDRLATIFADIQDYHASTTSVAELAAAANVGQLALYHLVPAPQNAVMERIFRRDLPGDVILTEDGMIFDLPAGSDSIEVR